MQIAIYDYYLPIMAENNTNADKIYKYKFQEISETDFEDCHE